MKNLFYEEKLRLAKEALESGSYDKETIEYIFPELKESEDEKIRKDIIRVFTGEIPYTSKEENEKYITWLEKQGASYTKEDIDDAYLKGISDAKNEIEKQHEANYQIRKDIATFIFNYRGDIKDRAKWMNYLGIKISFAEKQDNQKSQGKSALEAIKEEKKIDDANKVEPKFHEGEWIVWQDKCCKVNYNGCGYELVDQNGLSTSLEYGTVDENAHIWDITKDAEDGDVLVSDNIVFIFNKIHDIWIKCHCSLYEDNSFYGGDFDLMHIKYGKEVFPATKDQRDTLMKAMADAGYTFDFEKKELKKIEQSSTWSEKDEKMILGIEQVMNCASLLNIAPQKIDKVRTWLKSIKERIE